jgi:hypothetical protein
MRNIRSAFLIKKVLSVYLLEFRHKKRKWKKHKNIWFLFCSRKGGFWRLLRFNFNHPLITPLMTAFTSPNYPKERTNPAELGRVCANQKKLEKKKKRVFPKWEK